MYNVRTATGDDFVQWTAVEIPVRRPRIGTSGWILSEKRPV